MPRLLRRVPVGVALAALWAPGVLAAPAGGHADPIAPALLGVAVILMVAKVGGDLAARFGQPPVLGELVAGVLLGNLDLLGIGWAEPLQGEVAIEVLASLGVILLLFEVGLESTVGDMLKVGPPSLLVALVGVAAPFALGWGVGAVLQPERSAYAHAFLGATLTATSVGITARVFQDLGRSRSPESRVILGAAVIDDVLGLVILAIVSGVIVAADRGQPTSFVDIGVVVGKAVVFLFGALVLGLQLSPRLFRLVAALRVRGVLLATALAFCFTLAYLAAAIGLAPIVGAYAAGLVLEDVHFRHFVDRRESLAELVHPLSSFLVPVFFVLTGMRVTLDALGRTEVLGLGAALTAAAIVGKLVAGLGAIGPRLDRLSIGIGMVPRGEVGLIFANIGLGLAVAGERVVDEALYAAVVMMVLVTTMITPPALKWSLGRFDPKPPEP
jgi:Kef-type K+ transport system membrane component KefB